MLGWPPPPAKMLNSGVMAALGQRDPPFPPFPLPRAEDGGEGRGGGSHAKATPTPGIQAGGAVGGAEMPSPHPPAKN